MIYYVGDIIAFFQYSTYINTTIIYKIQVYNIYIYLSIYLSIHPCLSLYEYDMMIIPAI